MRSCRLFQTRGDAAYVGEAVSQTEHALQSARLAETEGAAGFAGRGGALARCRAYPPRPAGGCRRARHRRLSRGGRADLARGPLRPRGERTGAAPRCGQALPLRDLSGLPRRSFDRVAKEPATPGGADERATRSPNSRHIRIKKRPSGSATGTTLRRCRAWRFPAWTLSNQARGSAPVAGGRPVTRVYDDAVVGAGIIGLAHAYHLARQGAASLSSNGASAPGRSIRNFGMLWPIGQPAGELRALALRSLELWLEILRQGSLWHEQTGSLHLAYHDDEVSVLRRVRGDECRHRVRRCADRAPRRLLRAGGTRRGTEGRALERDRDVRRSARGRRRPARRAGTDAGGRLRLRPRGTRVRRPAAADVGRRVGRGTALGLLRR